MLRTTDPLPPGSKLSPIVRFFAREDESQASNERVRSTSSPATRVLDACNMYSNVQMAGGYGLHGFARRPPLFVPKNHAKFGVPY